MNNYCQAQNGRIWLAWDKNVWEIKFLAGSDQVLHCYTRSILLKAEITLSCVYALKATVQKQPFWDDLFAFSRGVRWPWLVAGDFNSFLFYEDEI